MNSAHMDLSIVIVNWNSCRYLSDCLCSIYAHPPACAFEVIVLDAASHDGSEALVRTQFPSVHFVQAETNPGFARSNNAAAHHARGALLLLLNPDTVCPPGALDALIRALRERPDAGIAGARLRNGDGSVQDSCVQAFPSLLREVLDSNLLRRWFPRASLWGNARIWDEAVGPSPVDAVSGACLLIRRELFERVGRFSEDYFMYSEDVDLCFKAHRAGWAVLLVPDAAVVHYGGGSSAHAASSVFSDVLRMESRWRFFRKHRSRGYAAAFRAVMGLAALIRLAASSVWWLCTPPPRRDAPAAHALRRWSARLRWVLGGEHWARCDRSPETGRALPATSAPL